jgi:hypothetical protein
VLTSFAGTRIRELERLEGRLACTNIAVTALSKPEDVKRGIEEQVSIDDRTLNGLLIETLEQMWNELMAHETGGESYIDR